MWQWVTSLLSSPGAKIVAFCGVILAIDKTIKALYSWYLYVNERYVKKKESVNKVARWAGTILWEISKPMAMLVIANDYHSSRPRAVSIFYWASLFIFPSSIVVIQYFNQRLVLSRELLDALDKVIRAEQRTCENDERVLKSIVDLHNEMPEPKRPIEAAAVTIGLTNLRGNVMDLVKVHLLQLAGRDTVKVAVKCWITILWFWLAIWVALR
jgi:hypothetical protein